MTVLPWWLVSTEAAGQDILVIPPSQTEAGRPPGCVLRGSAPLQLAAQPRLPRSPSRAEVLPDQSGVRLDYPGLTPSRIR
ncbi:unnamed protein product [Arctogadus glacialis]